MVIVTEKVNEYMLLGNPNGSHAHTSSNTHARHADTLVGALELIEKGRDLSATGVAQRVAAEKQLATE